MEDLPSKEIIETLKIALQVLRNKVYVAESFNQKEEYVRIDAAMEWLEGVENGRRDR